MIYDNSSCQDIFSRMQAEKVEVHGQMCAAVGIKSYDKSCNSRRMVNNPQGEGELDEPACGYKREGGRACPILASPHQTVIGCCRVNLLSESFL